MAGDSNVAVAMSEKTAPSQTLYVKNLNDKVKKKELRESLYALFSQHGLILDVVALKTPKMRGQAFIVFENVQTATTAMRVLQMFPFYDKEMLISYARTKSNKAKEAAGEFRSNKGSKASRKSNADSADDHEEANDAEMDEDEDDDGTTGTRKRAINDVDEDEETAPDSKRLKDNEEEDEENEPNQILFVTRLPPTTTEDALSALFSQHDGFREVRIVPGRTDIAFVEYETDEHANAARDALHGSQLAPGRAINVQFARKD